MRIRKLSIWIPVGSISRRVGMTGHSGPTIRGGKIIGPEMNRSDVGPDHLGLFSRVGATR